LNDIELELRVSFGCGKRKRDNIREYTTRKKEEK